MMLAAVPPPAANSVKTPTTSQAYLKGSHVRETKSLIAELCRQFYNLGWVYGTGGSITVKVHDDSVPKSDQLIIMSPSLRKKKKSKARVLRTNILAVQKERIVEEDMYLLSPTGSILFPPLPKSPKCSDFSPLFTKAYNRRNADAVLHSHGIESCLVTTIDPLSKKFRHKRIAGRHTTIKTHALNLNNEAGTTPRCVVLDIEGTTTPISFVTDVLFPYARENVRMHLEETYDTLYTQDDIKLLRSQVCDDLQNGVAGAILVPNDEAGKEEVIAALVANVEEMIKADRKITSLKQLQGHIWQTGFEKNELKGVVFDDVPQALERWHASGVKVYIYSSGSRLAQRLIFGYTNHGDLRKYLCGFFDTTVGNKKETKSYVEISEFLGVDKPSDILFVTDVFQEAVAAKTAGLEVTISVRPGNGPLPENHGFTTITSFTEIPF